MKKSFNAAVNFLFSPANNEPQELNEVLFKLVVIGFSIGLIVVVDSILYGFLTR